MSTAIQTVSGTQSAPPIIGLLPVDRLTTLRHRRFTVEEYENLVQQGRITENDRCELIHGVITDKLGIGKLHIACIHRLTGIMAAMAANRFVVSIQNPIQLAASEPEPDCTLLKMRADFYAGEMARATDVLLLIEVADTSLEFDRKVKRPLYAEAGIADYWIVNVLDSCIEIYRQPRPDETYAESRIARHGESIALLALPDLVVSVNDILGPATPAT
jgi:Uma2 family endonuclease